MIFALSAEFFELSNFAISDELWCLLMSLTALSCASCANICDCTFCERIDPAELSFGVKGSGTDAVMAVSPRFEFVKSPGLALLISLLQSSESATGSDSSCMRSSCSSASLWNWVISREKWPPCCSSPSNVPEAHSKRAVQIMRNWSLIISYCRQ